MAGDGFASHPPYELQSMLHVCEGKPSTRGVGLNSAFGPEPVFAAPLHLLYYLIMLHAPLRGSRALRTVTLDFSFEVGTGIRRSAGGLSMIERGTNNKIGSLTDLR